MSWGEHAVYVGVLIATLSIPSARNLKDRRRVVHSARDRVRAKFKVSCNEVPNDRDYKRAQLVITTAGGDPRVIRSTLDKVEDRLGLLSEGHVVMTSIDVERWGSENQWEDGFE